PGTCFFTGLASRHCRKALLTTVLVAHSKWSRCYDDLSDSSDSNSDEEDERVKKSKDALGGDASSSGGKSLKQSAKREASVPLPKPDELFKSVSKPAFLYNPLNKQIDWESRAVKAPEEPAREFKPWKANAVPPPHSCASEPERKKGAPPGMDMAIKWSNVYEDNGDDAPQPFTGNARFLPDEEQAPDSDEDTEAGSASAKKRRVETFQQKEKRKRDLGQATSDKSFVEEEKRILRQKVE
uniref:Chromosome 1 open reading frame 52 n=1 Tax=Gadus morhua TaxID=8049 RepID=A0A8C5AAY3_GADMO